MVDLNEQIKRIRRKIAERSLILNPCCDPGHVKDYEQRHKITLSENYRRFITEVGDGGQGPPFYGICALGKAQLGESKRDDDYWDRLPDINYDFPFTKAWIWEDGETSDEGEMYQVDFGSIRLGTHGCAQYFHLIVTGSERGNVWDVADVGMGPAGDF